MRPIDRSKLGPFLVAEHHGVHQAAGPGHYRRAAAGAPKDGHAQLATGFDLDFLLQPRGSSHDNHRRVRFPETQRLARLARALGFVEQGFVQGQILGRRR